MADAGIAVSVTETLEDGRTVFRDRVIPFTGMLDAMRMTGTLPATSLSFRWTPGTFDFDIHLAPRRRLVLVLEGGLEIVVGAGERRVFRAGDVLEITDAWGQGHRSRALDGRPFRSAFIALDDEVHLDRRTSLDSSIEGRPSDLRYPRNVATADGGSTTVWERMPYRYGGPEGLVTEEIPLTGFQFVLAPATLDYDWHTAPQRQAVIVLTGGLETETTDGSLARVESGAFLFGEDTTGRGHRTRAVEGKPRLSVFAHRH